MTKSLLQFTGLMALIVAGVLWLAGGFSARIAPGSTALAAAEAMDTADVVPVERVTSAVAERTSGTLVSANRTTVSSRILARINEIRVRAGDLVNAGDVLVTLERDDLEARVAQARDGLAAAEAELELAQVAESRARDLLDQGVGTRQALDEAVSTLRVAESEVKRRRQALSEARTALSYAEIRTPVGGRVVDRLAQPGDVASPGVPLLEIYDPARLRVEAPVRESLAVGLSVGDTLRVAVDALGRDFEGVIDEIVPFAEPGARTLLVKVALPGDPRLFSGLFARVFVPAGETSRIVIPTGAVARIGQLSYVTVVGTGDRRARRLITTGKTLDGGRIEVLSGLDAGESVVLRRE
jgi:RND family efflux transporter MFP subunit